MKGMQELINASMKDFTEGSIVKGTILQVRSREVLVDIGYKSEGMISLGEFDNSDELKIGDEVDVLLEQLENDQGMVVLSREKASQKQNWDKIVAASTEGGTINGKVKAVVKGGLLVNVGVEAFLPGSQIDITPPKNLNEYVGKTFEFKIVKINEERKNIVISRRELIEAERAEKRSKFLADMTVGSTVKGKVKNITDFGAFIDLDGIDGLLHITDMSWGRISHPTEMVKIGEEIQVVILDINMEKQRVSLGLKQKSENPWEKVIEKYPVGTKVKGKVVNLVPYGAFVEIEQGVEGLIHVSELSWTKRIARASDVLNVGQEVEAVVIGINKEEQKVSLGVRQLDTNPWDEIGARYPVATKVSGKIRNLTSYGAFVELTDGIDGMIHVSDLSWTRKINHPSEVLKKGDDVEAVVLEIDRNNQRIALGIKQLSEDPWKTIEVQYKMGLMVTGKVTKIASFGAFIELADGIDGLVHISQISDQRVERVKDVLKIGDDVTARVIKVDKEDRRIGLSIKAANYDEAQLEKERQVLDNLKPGEDLASLEHAFDLAEEEYRPGQGKK
ncbi:MAG: 30S ribosomal protein S1 [Verrucomicrobiota bacterium]|nr:30S ribosomal protein S1 [Verrucomicrobiota bacterium]